MSGEKHGRQFLTYLMTDMDAATGESLLALTGALNLGGCESYPGVFQPFGGFADDTPIEDGYVSLPDAPGIGFEKKAALYEVLLGLS